MIHPKIRVILALFHYLLPFGSAQIQWPLKRASVAPGDIYLAGFFPIHEIDYELVCGKIDEEGLQQLETFLYTVNAINKDDSILPGVKLGVLGLDSCDSSAHVLEVAMDFMDGFIASNQNLRKQLQCGNGEPLNYNGNFSRLIGVIGGRSSRVSIQLANLLRVFQVPQVSYKSNAPSLSNVNLYEYFFRTVAPVNHQVSALVEIIKFFKWTYISVVYSDSDYGNTGFESLQVSAAKEKICFATQQSVNIETFIDSDYDDVLDALIKEKASGVVVFGEQVMALNVMMASKRKGVHDRFVWLGSEAWGSRDFAVKGYEDYADGALVVAYFIKPPPGFFDHFRSLTPENSKLTNPWFYELWERKKKCRLPDFPLTPHNRGYDEICKGPIPIREYMQKMPSAQLVRDAVYSVATALNDIHKEKCGGKPGLCKAMEKLEGRLIRKYLLAAKFYDDHGNLFQFDSVGDAPPRYAIANYQRDESRNLSYWRPVGSYIKDGDAPARLEMDMDKATFKLYRKEFPESVCSKPCVEGETKVVLDSNPCCWSCFNCTDHQYISVEGGCRECPKGQRPGSNKTFCDRIPETSMSYGNPWALGCIAIAVLGILVTVAVTVIFWRYWETPIIKASARELSALLLCGIFMSFFLTFAIVSRPTTATCGLVRFFLGFSYTVCYSAIVTKTRRIALIFERKGRRQKPKYTSQQTQLMIAGSIMSVEAVINATWLMYDFPSTDHEYPTREDNILICGGSDNASYLLGLLYPFLLMILCTVYAFKTRKCPDGFNEARHITFTNYTTCVIWLAFLPTFTLHSSNNVRTTTLSLLLSLSATVQIVCLFLPKAYVAMMQPENNTKGTVMGYTGGTSSSGTTSGGTTSGTTSM